MSNWMLATKVAASMQLEVGQLAKKVMILARTRVANQTPAARVPVSKQKMLVQFVTMPARNVQKKLPKARQAVQLAKSVGQTDAHASKL